MPKIKTLDKYISVNEFCDITFDGIPEDYKDSFADGMAYMLDLLDKMEPADVIGCGNASWIVRKGEVVCSKCLKRPVIDRESKMQLTDYCPNCGRRMRKD